MPNAWVGIVCLVMVMTQIYVCGSFATWMGAGSFGQRRLVGLTVLLAVGLAARSGARVAGRRPLARAVARVPADAREWVEAYRGGFWSCVNRWHGHCKKVIKRQEQEGSTFDCMTDSERWRRRCCNLRTSRKIIWKKLELTRQMFP